MQIRLRRTTLALSMLAIASCKKGDPSHPSPEQCRSSCERVANLKLAPQKKDHQIIVHETDEHVDDVEDESKRNIALLQQQLATPDPWDPKSVENLPPKERQAQIERHRWEAEQLKYQRELAIKNANQAIVDIHRAYEKVKKEAEDWEKGAVSKAIDECVPGCMARPPAFSECLKKTQAVEDVSICERN